MLMTIMIPTYNRAEKLKRNIVHLSSIIHACNAEKDVCVIISDNCSPDDTQRVVSEEIRKNKDLQFYSYRNDKNYGLENFIMVLMHTDTQFGMFLGDDDLIPEEYLRQVLQVLKGHSAACIIPSYYNVDSDGNKTGKSRDLNTLSHFYEAGFNNCLHNSWRAHQISGLVIDCNLAKAAYSAHKVKNPYAQVFFVASNCLQVRTYHCTAYPVIVERPNMKTKDWGYGDCGLIPDMFENYRYLDGITIKQRAKLERKILFAQYWRVAMYLKRGPKAFFRCIRGIQRSENTSRSTAFWLPGIVFCSFAANGFKALFSGELLSVLKTKVDI